MKGARFQYKCRQCGEVEENPRTGEMHALGRLVDAITKDKNGGANTLWLLDVHNCEDGNYGVSDLIGYKVYEEG